MTFHHTLDMDMSQTIENHIWDDGFSPIVFAALRKEGDEKVISERIVSRSRTISKRFGQSFVILNLSFLEFSIENVSRVKLITKILTKPFIKSVALVGFKKKNSSINLVDSKHLNTFKNFDCFEHALAFTNEQIKLNVF